MTQEALRIAVCDDESALAAQLEERIRAWSLRRDCPCRVSAFPSGEALLADENGLYAQLWTAQAEQYGT